MKRSFIVAAIAAVASLTVAGTASADVERYQGTTTAEFTMTRPAGEVGNWSNLWTHSYKVTVAPDGKFAGTGVVSGHDQNGSYTGDEKITGQFSNDGKVTFTTKYVYAGVEYSMSLIDAPFGDTVSYAQVLPGVDWLVEAKVTEPMYGGTYQNHGDYVSSEGGGSDAAHSPIGMPIKAKSHK